MKADSITKPGHWQAVGATGIHQMEQSLLVALRIAKNDPEEVDGVSRFFGSFQTFELAGLGCGIDERCAGVAGKPGEVNY